MRVPESEYYDYVKRRRSNAQIEREALEGFVAERLDFARAAAGTAGSTASSGATASPSARSGRSPSCAS